MVHLHSLLSPEGTTAGQNANTPLVKLGREGFRGLLSEVGAAGADSSSGRESVTPASWDKFARVAPPPPESSPASAGNPEGASAPATDSSYDPFLQYVNSTSAPAAGNTSSTPATSSEPAVSSPFSAQQTFDDAYWAGQPAAVQALRNAPPEERTQMATQLAQQGYSIDVPIMVWGWDPYTTTNTRLADGYTWVPSALQSSVNVPPGTTFDGSTYDAGHPPAGSIAV